MEYDYLSSILNTEDVKLLHNRLIHIAECFVANYRSPLFGFSVASPYEKNLFFGQFNNTKADYDREATLVSLFEEQVKKTPNKTAVVCGDKSLTYAELNGQANRLARRLRKLGVKPDDFVAMLTERSLEMIVGIFGVLKAGGAYVPINTIYPDERVQMILSDCKPKVLLTDRSRTEFEMYVPTLDLTDESCYAESTRNLPKVNQPIHAAYVIYTSGTTGVPKGVVVEHKNVVRLLFNSKFQFDFDQNDVWTMFHSYGFDFSVWEMYGATLYGGKLIVVPEEISKNAEKFISLLNKEKVTVLNQVPSSFYTLLEHDSAECCKDLRYLIFGGEALSPGRLKAWRERHRNVKIVNMYGITETTVHVTYKEIAEAEIDKGVSNIGSAIPTLSVYICNGNHLCGIGMPGELCVAGDGVARGYLNRPELTAEKFTDNPFGEGKLYRSGDLAQWLPDGNIEYLGRIDEQVKIRGFRIELGEIDNAIRNIENVKDCAVIAKEDPFGEKAIYAYIVSEEAISISLIRNVLGQTLPGYMIPAYMAQIEAIPVTGNGKLDKKALPDIEGQSERTYVSPRTEAEIAICEAFAEILGIEQVGIKDNFFELGGHSLRATRLVNQIEAKTGMRIELKEVFAHPTPEELAANLTEDENYTPIPKAEEREYYPMSSSQRRTYIITELDKNNTAYNMSAGLFLRGRLDRARLEVAFKELIARHEGLRTAFCMEDGEPVQRIHPNVTAEVEYEEAYGMSKEAAKKALRNFVRPFDLSAPPLMRLKMIKTEENGQYLFFDMHHIVSDGMSVNIVIDELSKLYNGTALDPLRVQYRDYSEWMRTRDLSKQAEYWKSQFMEEAPILELPTDYPRPSVQSYAGNTVVREIPRELTEKIRKLCAQTDTTEYMVYLAGLMVMLSKYSRQEDIVVGSPISGRTHKDTEQILGMFVNTLAMRGYPAKEKTVRSFLSEIKETCLKAYENQEYSLDELIEALDMRRDMSRNPLFDVVMVLQNNENVRLETDDFVIVDGVADSTISQFDLTFNIQPTDANTTIAVNYCTALFEEENVTYLCEHYISALRDMAENVDKKIREISLLTEQEQAQILLEFNDTKAKYSEEETVVSVFEEQVEKTPDSIAVTYENESITYRELNRRANQLARKLREQGVKRDEFVAILAERSIEIVVGLLAIMKSGGAYMPIEPSYPADRIRLMLEDCGAKSLLTGRTSLPFATDITTWNLCSEESYASGTENLPRLNGSRDLAYLIYTSGTTGTPKGAMIEHRGILRLVKNNNFLQMSEATRVLQTGAIAFDASTLELWGTLLNGGTLVLTNQESLIDPIKLKSLIVKNGITIMWLTSSLFNQMVTQQPDLFDTLEDLLIGGEKLSAEHVNRFLQRKNGVRLTNGYGPTENTTFTTTFLIQKEYANIPIGYPITNTSVYVMQDEQLCGIGVPGELCTGGAGVARGYLNRPEETADKFRTNPFGTGLLYRTGDLVRWLPDGSVEYLGRIDEQVKIRGFRIELGEIESVILKQPEISDVAVVAKKDSSQELYLAAYVVGVEPIDLDEIRMRLMQKLPYYMVPGAIMQLDALPVTKNGKLDKSKLPEIEVQSTVEYFAPRTEAETAVCEAFAEVLGIEKIGITDNFFELGGHSLRATRVVNRIEAKTGMRIELKEIFAHPTPEELAAKLTGKESYTPIPNAQEKEYYPMSSAQRRTYIISQIDQAGLSYNIPIALALRGKLDPERLRNAFRALAERHEGLRTSFHIVDGEPIQRINTHVAVDVEYEESLALSAEEVRRSFEAFVRPFALDSAPLMRMKVIQTGEMEHYLFFDIHHIISDGMSMAVLIDEFSKLYNGEELKPLRVHYKDYSEWMRTRDLEKQASYWKAQFAEKPPALELPTDYSRPKVQSFRGDNVKTSLTAEDMVQLEEFCKKNGSTEYMVFLSALMVTLSKYSRQEDIVIGSPISGRTHQDTENMLGMFVNTLAMRGYPKKEKTFGQLLRELRDSSLRAYENQEYPFEELVGEVVAHRDVSRNPLFDVMLVLQNNEEVTLQMQGIEMIGTVPMARVSKFDLTFNIIKTDGKYHVDTEYCTDLFKRDFVERLNQHFIQAIRLTMEHTDGVIGEHSLLSAEEQDRILYQFNNTKTEYDREATIVSLFEQQVKKMPDKPAVVYGDKALTYAELNGRANRLARRLRRLGVKPDDFVAMLTERSLEMIVGIFGILKAGGAYVPIDPAYPEDRKQFMLEDCAPKAVVVYGTEINTGIPVIDLADSEFWTDSIANLKSVNRPNDLAYCIYTSGTTGKPKGVMVEHHGVANLREYFIEIQSLSEEDRVLQFASYAFDAIVSELSMSLLTGASLFIVDPISRQDTRTFEEFVKRNHITIAILPPPFVSQLNLEGLRTVITAGSETNRDIVMSNRHIPIYSNDYGPTEVTVCATYWKHGASEPVPEKIPIGKPICNKQVYILDGTTLCGIGIPGELCIAGDGLARGYLNKPELTAEKFIDNPYGEGRLYRTGDLARWLPDGNIEFLGRIDEQVKIRGFRIELGEIENGIRKLEVIKDCAVIVREDPLGDKAIYAYVVSDEKISISEVREALGRTLPGYMIPAYIAQIETIPVTRNGKPDKKALPNIGGQCGNTYVAPRTEEETTICEAFAEILGVELIGIQDDFFELGGHSLRATKLVNLIEAKTGSRLTLKEVFSYPTPECLATRLVGMGSYTPIPKAEAREYYEMSSSQKRTYFICQLDGTSTAYNMPACIEFEDGLSLARVQMAFDRLLARHEALRTSFDVQDGIGIQRISETVDETVEYEYVESFNNHIKNRITETFVRPFDLTKAPLIRLKVVQIGNRSSVLLFDMHHIISDGMSMTILIEEFSKLYNGEQLPELSAQYKDYSEWMRGKDLSLQKKYWVDQFDGDIPVLDMPLDYRRPARQSFKGDCVSRTMEKELSDRVRRFAYQTGTTEFMVLLSGLMVTLSKYSQQEDIVIGTPVSGRVHKDTEHMLGMFVNTLAIRGRPEKQKSFYEFLSEMKSRCLEAYENQEYPFEELVETIDLQRDAARNPLFDVLFVLQNNENVNLWLNGIGDMRLEGIDNQVAKFDLSVSISAEGEISVEYSTDLFKRDSMQRFMSHFIELLRDALESPTKELRQLNPLTAAEENRILVEFNSTQIDYPKDKTVVDMFENQVAKNPDRVAVVAGNKRYTFRELNSRANSIAQYLVEQGIKQNDIVAIHLQRNEHLIPAMLGVLKAGAAYLPIVPELPIKRKKFMIEDCCAAHVLTFDGAELFEGCVPTIDVALIEKNEHDDLDISRSQQDNSYVIYTSGSTGTPKGTVLTHKGLLNFCHNNTEIVTSIRRQPNARMLSTTTISFDIFVTESLLCLCNGVCTVIANEDEQVSQQGVARIVREQGCTAMQTTPSKMKLYMEDSENCAYLKDLNTIILGGEAFPPSLFTEIRKYTDADIYNIYGPSEATVWVSTKYVNSEDITIGRPYSNTQLYIMDGQGLCGIGMPGELCIAGDCLGNGYLKRLELTAEKFTDNPFGEGRLYRTGDLARWRPNGEIEYIGRLDDQIKIRGLRIEPGEIEHTIRSLESIKDCAVIVRGSSDESKEICAYITSDVEVDIVRMRAQLGKLLPTFMVPAYMVQIKSLPTTRNGKLDKKALPIIADRGERNYLAPRNELEEYVVKAFENVLSLQQVGIEDDFFELGGHSIKAIRLTTILQAKYDISLQDVYNLRTPISICEQIGGKAQIGAEEKFELLRKRMATTQQSLVKPESKRYEAYMAYQEKYRELKAKRCTQGSILLTGATGYLGIYILRELLNDSVGKIYLIVRGETKETARKRLNEIWVHYFREKLQWSDRLIILCGDITKGAFGLDRDTYTLLANEVDIVINSAASTKHFDSYHLSYEANVTSVKMLADFCKQGKGKTLNHISTLSVADGMIPDVSAYAFTEDDMDVGQSPDSVYVSTKFSAEKFLWAEKNDGLRVNIFRVGNLQGDMKTGVLQRNPESNAFLSMLHFMIAARIFPKGDFILDYTPVDQAAKACTLPILYTDINNEIFHLFNRVSLSLVANTIADADSGIRVIEPEEFIDEIQRMYRLEGDEVLQKFLLHSGLLRDRESTNYVIYHGKTDYILDKLGFSWSEISEENIGRLFRNMAQDEPFSS